LLNDVAVLQRFRLKAGAASQADDGQRDGKKFEALCVFHGQCSYLQVVESQDLTLA